MKFSRDELISILEDVINDKPRLRDWDDLVSVRHKDEYTKFWSNRLREIEINYSNISHGQLLNDKGVLKLKEILEELKRS